MQNQEFFVIHHVGGRGGGRTFPHIINAEKSFFVVMYEPDKDAHNSIIKRLDVEDARYLLLTEALSKFTGRSNLYVTSDPNCSSILEPNPNEMWQDFYFPEKTDYDFFEALQIKRVDSVQVTTLDKILSTNIEVPAPDFLSIDTQGSELDILKGSKNALDSIVGVQVEVEFIELYKEQPFFTDIHDYLLNMGFQFMDIDFKRGSKVNLEISLRGKRPIIYGDALFLKRPELCSNQSKLAFAALSFGYTEFASGCKIDIISNPFGWQNIIINFKNLVHKNTVNAKNIPLSQNPTKNIRELTISKKEISPFAVNQNLVILKFRYYLIFLLINLRLYNFFKFLKRLKYYTFRSIRRARIASLKKELLKFAKKNNLDLLVKEIESQINVY
jgi:FkbM family methyltransferase